MYEYTITLSTAQAKEIQDALEAIMRWKLKQPEIMREYLPDKLNWSPAGDFNNNIRLINTATELLRLANNIMIPYVSNSDPSLKDEQWNRIYNIFQVIRHAIWEAESDKKSYNVAAGEPMKYGKEDLPKIEWRKKGET